MTALERNLAAVGDHSGFIPCVGIFARQRLVIGFFQSHSKGKVPAVVFLSQVITRDFLADFQASKNHNRQRRLFVDKLGCGSLPSRNCTGISLSGF